MCTYLLGFVFGVIAMALFCTKVMHRHVHVLNRRRHASVATVVDLSKLPPGACGVRQAAPSCSHAPLHAVTGALAEADYIAADLETTPMLAVPSAPLMSKV